MQTIMKTFGELLFLLFIACQFIIFTFEIFYLFDYEPTYLTSNIGFLFEINGKLYSNACHGNMIKFASALYQDSLFILSLYFLCSYFFHSDFPYFNSNFYCLFVIIGFVLIFINSFLMLIQCDFLGLFSIILTAYIFFFSIIIIQNLIREIYNFFKF